MLHTHSRSVADKGKEDVMKKLEVEIKKKLKNFDLDMSFYTEKGCLGILGASGCGKSMTLKAIAGIITPESGKISTENKVFFDSANKINMPPQKRRVGYLFQNYALFPNMTVADNIAAGVVGGADKKKLSKEEINKKVYELMEKFHISELKNQYPFKLSGGQQQRTALARIIASDPEILLLDEPFSAMDTYLREELQIELKNRLNQFDGCSIIVSHDRDEIYKLCDRTMIIDQGRTVVVEDTKKLFECPKHKEAARLTGCKNISKIEKIASNKVHSLDWGIDLEVDSEVPDNVKYIGIRAHDFVPVNKDSNKENLIEISICDITETPFERTFLFKCKRNPKENMWMKLNRDDIQIPEAVYVDKKNILLLTE